MECEICSQDFDPDTAWFTDVCDECVQNLSTCRICGDVLAEDSDSDVCWSCDAELLLSYMWLL